MWSFCTTEKTVINPYMIFQLSFCSLTYLTVPINLTTNIRMITGLTELYSVHVLPRLCTTGFLYACSGIDVDVVINVTYEDENS